MTLRTNLHMFARLILYILHTDASIFGSCILASSM